MQHTINFIELLGTFLLGIEAIKLSNIKISKGKFRNVESVLNPKIYWEDNTNRNKPVSLIFRFLLISMICTFSLYLISKYLFDFDLLDNLFPESNLATEIIQIILATLFIPLIWTFLIVFLNYVILFLKFVENKTHTGIVGIIGISLFFVKYIIVTYLELQN